jgi:hypothetical protein
MSSTDSDSRFQYDRSSSNRAGITLMDNQVGHVVADNPEDAAEYISFDLQAVS